jgi:hypothetical protein
MPYREPKHKWRGQSVEFVVLDETQHPDVTDPKDPAYVGPVLAKILAQVKK